MMASNLTYKQWLNLFGKGMGLLTVGAAGLVVGVQGPISGQLTVALLALSIPFMTVGAAIALLPAFVPIQTDGIDTETEPDAEPVPTPDAADRAITQQSLDD